LSDVPAGPAPGTNPAEAIDAAVKAIAHLSIYPISPTSPRLRELAEAAVAAATPHLAAAERERIRQLAIEPKRIREAMRVAGYSPNDRTEDAVAHTIRRAIADVLAAVPGQPQDTT
jgi:hypothetical protein